MTNNATRAATTIDQHYDIVNVDTIKTHPRNIRKGELQTIRQSIEQNGFYGACVVQKSTGLIIAGNHRYIAARAAGLTELPVISVDVTDDEALRIMLVDNRSSDVSTNDDEALAALLLELSASDTGLNGTGFDDDSLNDLLAAIQESDESAVHATDGAPVDEGRKTLTERFGVPPFSVLDARQGYWQARKRSWLALGIKSEVGRGGGSAAPAHCPDVTRNNDGTLNYAGTNGQSKRFDRQRAPNAAPGGSPRPAMDYSKKQRGTGTGKAI